VRAAVYARDRMMRIVDRPLVPPGPGEVQIAVAYVGICGTDLHIRHGAMDDRVPHPAVLGHEASGTVAAVGDDVPADLVGQQVTVMPLRWCGECAACRSGHAHVCQKLRVVGVDLPGAMQERWTVPAELVVPLPEDLPLREGALVEPTAVAVHDVRRAGLQPGEATVVVGAGPIGLLIARVAQAADAEVVLVEPDPHRRTVAERIGLTALDPSATDVRSFVRDWTGGAGVPIAFEVSGAEAGMRTAVDVLGVRGRLVVVAIHPLPSPVDLNQVFLRELTVLGARVYTRRDFEDAVQMVRDGTVPAEALISDVMDLRDVSVAFDRLESGGNAVKVLIDCQSG